MRSFLSAVLLTGLVGLSLCRSADSAKPNIVVILADDIGYGDLGCYGAQKIKTPNLDGIARAGMRFTDAHSPAAVCTPTRYSLLTGQYSFRHRPGASILSGIAPLSIPADRTTLPQLAKKGGYTTAAVGKWHLGLGDKETDYNVEIKPGAREAGFDYSFLIPATGDRIPTVYVENGRVVGYDPKDPIRISYGEKIGNDPTGKENPDKLTVQRPSHGHDGTIVAGISRIGFMTGGHAARWKDETMADEITKKAVSFIDSNKDRPFLLYFATHDAHVPRVPHPRFRGTSGHGLRGDCIQEFDACVGEVLASLKKNNLTEKTLVIVTSDNGGVMDDGYVDGTGNDMSGHRCNGSLRGFKGGLYEGGHRVPFLVQWPGKTPAGKTSAELICHVDLCATLASVMGVKLGDKDAPDSFDQSAAILAEKPAKSARTNLLHQAGNFAHHALREGDWKLIGGVVYKNKKGPTAPQLFNLADDPSETKDLAKSDPDRVEKMRAKLTAIEAAERTRP